MSAVESTPPAGFSRADVDAAFVAFESSRRVCLFRQFLNAFDKPRKFFSKFQMPHGGRRDDASEGRVVHGSDCVGSATVVGEQVFQYRADQPAIRYLKVFCASAIGHMRSSFSSVLAPAAGGSRQETPAAGGSLPFEKAEA